MKTDVLALLWKIEKQDYGLPLAKLINRLFLNCSCELGTLLIYKTTNVCCRQEKVPHCAFADGTAVLISFPWVESLCHSEWTHVYPVVTCFPRGWLLEPPHRVDHCDQGENSFHTPNTVECERVEGREANDTVPPTRCGVGCYPRQYTCTPIGEGAESTVNSLAHTLPYNGKFW